MPNSQEPSNSLYGSRAAIPLVGAFLLGVAGVTAYSLWQSPRRAQAEQFSQNTAVGDTQYFKVPSPPTANPEPVLTKAGKPMVPVSYKVKKFEDISMHPVYRDPATGLTLYHPEAKEEAYVKVAPNRYLEVK